MYDEVVKVLLIIGNGFDLSHGLHICYNDFKEYLYETDSVLYDLLKNKMSDFLWSNFEEDLGYLNFQMKYRIIMRHRR